MPSRAALGLAPVGSSPSSPSRFGSGMSTSNVSGVIDSGGGGGGGAGGEGSSIAGILRGAGGGGAANAANNNDDFSERLRRRLSLSDVSSSYETINAILGRPPEANNNGDDGSQGAGGVAHFSNFLGAGAPMTSSSPPTSRQGQYDAEMKRNGMQGLIMSDSGGGEMMAVPASRGPTGAGAPVGGMARSGNLSGSSGGPGGATTVTAALSDEYEQLKKMFEEVSGHSILDPPPGDDAAAAAGSDMGKAMRSMSAYGYDAPQAYAGGQSPAGSPLRSALGGSRVSPRQATSEAFHEIEQVMGGQSQTFSGSSGGQSFAVPPPPGPGAALSSSPKVHVPPLSGQVSRPFQTKTDPHTGRMPSHIRPPRAVVDFAERYQKRKAGDYNAQPPKVGDGKSITASKIDRLSQPKAARTRGEGGQRASAPNATARLRARLAGQGQQPPKPFVSSTRTNTVFARAPMELDGNGGAEGEGGVFGEEPENARPRRTGKGQGGGRKKTHTGIDGVFSGLGGAVVLDELYPGDDPQDRKDKRDRLARQANARRAKKRAEQLKPEMFIDVNMPSGTLRNIAVRKGDNPADLAVAFAAECTADGEATLSDDHIAKLTALIRSRIAEFKAAVAEREFANTKMAKDRERQRWQGRTTRTKPFKLSTTARVQVRGGRRGRGGPGGYPAVQDAPAGMSGTGMGGGAQQRGGTSRDAVVEESGGRLIGRLHVEVTPEMRGTIIIREGDDALQLVERFRRNYPRQLQDQQLSQIEGRIQERLDGFAAERRKNADNGGSSNWTESAQSVGPHGGEYAAGEVGEMGAMGAMGDGSGSGGGGASPLTMKQQMLWERTLKGVMAQQAGQAGEARANGNGPTAWNETPAHGGEQASVAFTGTQSEAPHALSTSHLTSLQQHLDSAFVPSSEESVFVPHRRAPTGPKLFNMDVQIGPER